MSVTDVFEAGEALQAAREDLAALLAEVLGSVFGQEATAASPRVALATLPPGPVVSARLAIHDEAADTYTLVEVRAGADAARILAARMFSAPDPTVDDLLDAVAELGNILAGNVKSLLCQSCRLSLPTAEVSQAAIRSTDVNGVAVTAEVLGHAVELAVHVVDTIHGLYWPGSTYDALETPS